MSDLDTHALGLGTWENDVPEECAESVQTALELGYRHIDAAQAYGNEDAVGRGIAASSVDRDELFLTTKVDTGNLGYDDVHVTARESLDRLGTDYVDLLYVHWPVDAYDPESTLAAFQELSDEWLTRYIGVSNFEPRHLDEARGILDEPVYANQVELHPYLQQTDLREYAAEHDHHLVGYSPLARGEVLDDPVLADVAEKHDATIPQVTLAWALDIGVAPIPKATSADHIRDNWGAHEVELDEADHDRIADLDRGQREVDFGGAPWHE